MRFSVGQKVAVVLVLLLLLVGGSAIDVLGRAGQLVREVEGVARAHELRVSLANLLRNLSDADAAERAFAATGDSSLLPRFREAVAAPRDDLLNLHRLDSAERRHALHLRRLDSLVGMRTAELDHSLPLVANGAAPSLGARSAVDSEIRRVAAEMDLELRDALARRVIRAHDTQRATVVIAATGSVLAVLVALFGMAVVRAERRETRRQLQRVAASEARLRGAMEGSMDAFFLFEAVRDGDGRVVDFRFVDVNDRAARLLRRSRAELAGERILKVLPAMDELGFFARFAAVVASGEMLDEEYAVLSDAVDAEWLHHTVVRVGDGVAVTARDVTERRRLEERVRQAQKMEAVGRLASGVAHDFSNMLTAIRASTRLVRDSLAEDDVRRDELADVDRVVERASQLTRQLLAISRNQESHPRALDINQVVRGMEGLLRRAVPSSVRIVTQLEPALRPVRMDPVHLEQVLLNLAVNARDAMPAGGTIDIITENAELLDSRAHPHGTIEPGHWIVLTVRDSGVGMDPDTRAHLFEPFFTTKSDGTGLGLATTFGIVRQAGGHILVASEPGGGATFEVYLPRATPASERGLVVNTAQERQAPAARGGVASEAAPPGAGLTAA